jgi:CheY-like chemotaxis protein
MPKMDKNIRILILEDRATDADLMEFKLMEAGLAFTAKRVINEKQFLRELEGFSPDVILSDYDLPQYTGSLVLVASRKSCPEVPFILVTGALDESDGVCEAILAQGASECVFKRNLDRLAPAVRKVMRAKSGSGITTGKKGH